MNKKIISISLGLSLLMGQGSVLAIARGCTSFKRSPRHARSMNHYRSRFIQPVQKLQSQAIEGQKEQPVQMTKQQQLMHLVKQAQEGKIQGPEFQKRVQEFGLGQELQNLQNRQPQMRQQQSGSGIGSALYTAGSLFLKGLDAAITSYDARRVYRSVGPSTERLKDAWSGYGVMEKCGEDWRGRNQYKTRPASGEERFDLGCDIIVGLARGIRGVANGVGSIFR